MSGLLDDVFASPEQHNHGDVSWPDGLDMPHDERDVDVFAMVGALDLDAELPDMDAVPLTAAPHQELFLSTCPTDVPPYGATVPAQKPSSNYSSKMDRLRARNRLAQTKCRQKAKEQMTELQNTISRVQSSLEAAQAKQQQLQSQHAQLSQRCSLSTAACDALLSVSKLVPEQGPSESRSSGESQSQMHPIPSPEAAKQVPAPVDTQCAATPAELVCASAPRQPAGSLLFSQAEPPPPLPLASFKHHRPICLEVVDPSRAHVPSLEPSDTANYVTHHPCPTHACSSFTKGEAATYIAHHPGDAHACDSFTGRDLANRVGELRQITDDFRSAEAARCGCGVSDVAWFLQSHVKVSDGALADSSSASRTQGQTGKDGEEVLSFSSTFNSGPCIASIVTLYLMLVLENTLTTRGVDVLEGTVPEDIADVLASCGMSDIRMGQSLSSHGIATCDHKRRRGDYGSTHPGPKPFRSKAPVMEAAGITDADMDAFKLRCGVGALAPLRETVRKVFRNTVQRFCGILPMGVLRTCFERHVTYMDRMVQGFTATNSASTSPTSSSSAARSANDSTPPVTVGSTAPLGTEMAAGQDARGAHGAPGPNGAGSGARSRAEWMRESKLRAAAAILAVREALVDLLDEMPSAIMEAADSDKLASASQMVRRVGVLSCDFGYNQILVALDSTKMVMGMMMDAFQPFLGQYFQVDAMHANLYKSVKPTAHMRARMAEVWMTWERRKRQIDGDMLAARALLAALPSHIPLSYDFLSHINALIATSCTLHAYAADHAHPRDLLCPRESSGHSTPALRAFTQPLYSHSGSTSGLVNMISDSEGMHRSQPWATTARYDAPCVGAMHQYSACLPAVRSALPDRVSFLGQHSEHVTTAERALRELRSIQRKETEVYNYNLTAQMPGAVLGLHQHFRVWSDYFMSQSMPPDFIELCQIAATQQNRFSLFEEPFH